MSAIGGLLILVGVGLLFGLCAVEWSAPRKAASKAVLLLVGCLVATFAFVCFLFALWPPF